MKKSQIIVILAILCAIVFIIIFISSGSRHSSPKLTISYIDELVKIKGAENLSWEDFDEFPHADIGSGNYVYQYEIAGGSHLYLSGPNLSSPPMYIYIIDSEGNRKDIKKSN
ncbi:MAG: hypothetical protein ACFWTJ_03185 [Lachnoclostridium sp.]|jgi:hypothetical protein